MLLFNALTILTPRKEILLDTQVYMDHVQVFNCYNSSTA
jgi:hypothetical protein